ncbi:MAG: pilus assembly FimT family protein [Planctomycetota bacterium]|jgi:prepilin-type N-terminal cleavage/methylation domain-containing protein
MGTRSRTSSIATARGFTLTELLVVVAIIGIVGTLTVIAYRGIAKDARLSSAENAVVAALDQARGLAMKRNSYVLVQFSSTFSEQGGQQIEVITSEWTGQSSGPWVVFSVTPLVRPVDRFVPIPGVPVRTLPPGVGVGCPTYGYAADDGSYDDRDWFTLSDFRPAAQFASEYPGNVIGVLYSSEGTVTSRNAQADSYRQYVDLSPPNAAGAGLQDIDGGYIDYDFLLRTGGQISSLAFDETFFEHVNPADEPYVRIAPFLAVYDHDVAREQYDTTQWSDPVDRRDDLSAFINANGKRIHFNRYSGVVMR